MTYHDEQIMLRDSGGLGRWLPQTLPMATPALEHMP
jgi:hypothetical protein